MPINPAQFITPVRQSRATSGLELGQFIAGQRNDAERRKTSAGYLALQTRQQDFSEKKHGQAELDRALAQLDDARLIGNADAVSAAEDNLRLIAQRNGYGISAAESTGPAIEQASVPKDELPATPGDAETGVLDADSPEFKAAAEAELAGPTESESDARIDAELKKDRILGGKDPAAFIGSAQPPLAQLLLAKQLGRVPGGPQATSTESAAPQAAGFSMPGRGIAPPRPLTSLTITDAKGRELYRATGDAQAVAERQRLRAQSVFSELAKGAGDDVERQLIQQAGDTAAGLIGTMPLEKAVKTGLDLYQDAMRRRNAMAVVEANRKPRFGSGGGGGGKYALGASGKADAALNDDADKVRTMWVNSEGYKKLAEQVSMLDDAEAGLMSPDGVAQNNALATLRRIQSGLTLNASEMRDFEGAAGMLEALKKRYERYVGQGELPEEYKRQVAAVIASMRSVADRRMERSSQEAYDYFMRTRARAGAPEIVQEKGEAIRDSLRGATKSNREKPPIKKPSADEEAADL